MTKTTQPTDAEMRARALSRWEGEGGSLAPRSPMVDRLSAPAATGSLRVTPEIACGSSNREMVARGVIEPPTRGFSVTS